MKGEIQVFKTEFLITEQAVTGEFNSEPYEYVLETENYPTGKQIRDIVYQAIEIEGIASDCHIQMTVEQNGEFFSSDECIVELVNIVRTEEPSNFIKWGDKIPHIFTVDKENSFIKFIL